MQRRLSGSTVLFPILLALASPSAGAGAGATRPPGAPEEPVRFSLSVSPGAVAPGAQARVKIQLEPAPGVKVNRYPRVRLQVPERKGLIAAGEASVGSDAPPPPDDLASGANYFTKVDPVELTLDVDASAPRGAHQIEGKLLYHYCVGSSFCAPARIAVKIPLTIR